MRFSLKKIVIIIACLLIAVFIIYPKFSEDTKLETIREVPLKPVFREDGNLGNFETEPHTGQGPGEGGKAHHLRPDQKEEEERMKGRVFEYCININNNNVLHW